MPQPASLPAAQPGLLHRLPLIGALTRAAEADIHILFHLLTIGLTALVLAMQVWGLVALVLTALAFVPVMFGILIYLAAPRS